MNERIEKSAELQAPVSRVWRALTDYREFGEWFRVKLDAPFEPGKVAQGLITHPGHEHVAWRAIIKAVEPEHLFSFTGHPYAVDASVDYEGETPTLVEFRLEPSAGGTLLRITETGFDKIPASRRAEAFRMNDGGWTAQLENIRKHVA
ncbi:vanillate O-demethylase oxidoreductase VanB [Rhodanobacter sp. B04]|uniref:SRPBCC family protein n=1 Tax=Rhodanobacter sp. B04 TaxID=1945860 RepID=UPI000987C6B9|nr:SRPBCC family protein [Rhodanobacter sp. B04]OOG62177.1 vanillate O-demethylase oxidoreductase VanB [Rhodanobacter sp. B04]